MDICMVKETKGTRVYFRVAPNFKNEFAAAAMVNAQDPSEAFRYIGRHFIDRVRQEKPDEFLKALEVVRSEDSPVSPDRSSKKSAATAARGKMVRAYESPTHGKKQGKDASKGVEKEASRK